MCSPLKTAALLLRRHWNTWKIHVFDFLFNFPIVATGSATGREQSCLYITAREQPETLEQQSGLFIPCVCVFFFFFFFVLPRSSKLHCSWC